MTTPSFKQVESIYSKKEPYKRGCSWITRFSHCLNFGYSKHGITIFSIQTQNGCIHSSTKKKICKVNNFWYLIFFNKDQNEIKRVNFILIFIKEELVSLLSLKKPFSSNLES